MSEQQARAERIEEQPRDGQPRATDRIRLGYLLKHAHLRLSEQTDAALALYGVDGREWAVLLRIGDQDSVSQQELAHRLGIDRTTMVAMVDALEAKKLVERHPHPGDRRKNMVELTTAGRETLRKATRAADDTIHRFLSPLSDRDAQQFTEALRILVP